MSNFALVIPLNIPTDKIKFRIIILSKFHSYTTHYRLKNLMASSYKTTATVLSTCWVHGVEFVVMKRVYLLWPSGSSKPLLFSRKHRKCLHLRVHFLVRFLRDHGRYFVKNTLIKGVVTTDPLAWIIRRSRWVIRCPKSKRMSVSYLKHVHGTVLPTRSGCFARCTKTFWCVVISDDDDK